MLPISVISSRKCNVMVCFRSPEFSLMTFGGKCSLYMIFVNRNLLYFLSKSSPATTTPLFMNIFFVVFAPPSLFKIVGRFVLDFAKLAVDFDCALFSYLYNFFQNIHR